MVVGKKRRVAEDLDIRQWLDQRIAVQEEQLSIALGNRPSQSTLDLDIPTENGEINSGIIEGAPLARQKPMGTGWQD